MINFLGCFDSPSWLELITTFNYACMIQQTIYGAGGRKFGFLNLGDLGCYPGLRLLMPNQTRISDCLQQEVSTMAKLNNQKLLESLFRMEQQLPGFKFSLYDFNRALNQRINGPSLYGKIPKIKLI